MKLNPVLAAFGVFLAASGVTLFPASAAQVSEEYGAVSQLRDEAGQRSWETGSDGRVELLLPGATIRLGEKSKLLYGENNPSGRILNGVAMFALSHGANPLLLGRPVW